MSEIQATLNFHVQFGNFVNIDLFQRGFYQLRCSVETNIKASQVEFANALPNASVSIVPTKSSSRQQQSGNSNNINQAQIIFMSKPFLINYKKQEIQINESFEFRLHLLVDTEKIEDCIDTASYSLNIELWSFNVSPSDPINPEFKDDMLDRMELCCTRSVRFHFISSTGLFHYIPVFFDYFHLSVVGLTVFGMLLAIHQPYLGFLRQSRNANAVGKLAEQSTLEAIFFGSPNLAASIRLQRSLRIHSTICSLLLRSLDSLQRHFDEISALLDPDQYDSLEGSERVDCADRLAKLTEILGQLQAEEDILQMANTQIAQLCAANVVLWSQFVAMARLRPEIELYLATIHAKLRRRRFLEAFLTASFPKNRLMHLGPESRSSSHSARASIIRQSEYLKSLPVLPLQQIDLDESSMLHPIIFEDVYSANMSEEEFAQNIAASSSDLQALSTKSSLSISTTTTTSKSATTTPRKKKSSSSNGGSKKEGGASLNSSTSSLSTNGGTSAEEKTTRHKGWSVKRKSKQTLKNEVADFGKKQNVTVVGVRWRRSEDEFLPASPCKSVNLNTTSATETSDAYAHSPPPSLPITRTTKFNNNNSSNDSDQTGVSKPRRFKSLIESPTDDEMFVLQQRFRHSFSDREVSPLYEPPEIPILNGDNDDDDGNKNCKATAAGDSWQPGSLSSSSDAPVLPNSQPIVAIDNFAAVTASSSSSNPNNTDRCRSNSCDVSSMLVTASSCTAMPVQAVRRSSSYGCLPLSPIEGDEAKLLIASNGAAIINNKATLAPLSLAAVDTSSLSSLDRKQSSCEEMAGEHQPVVGSTEVNGGDGAFKLSLRLSESDDRETDAGSVSSSQSRDRAGSQSQPHFTTTTNTTDDGNGCAVENSNNNQAVSGSGFWNEKLSLQEMLKDMQAIDEIASTSGTCLDTSYVSSTFSSSRYDNKVTSSTSCVTKQQDDRTLAASSCSAISLRASSSTGGLLSQGAFLFSAKFMRAKENVQRKIGTDYFGSFCSDQFASSIGEIFATPSELPLAYFCTKGGNSLSTGPGGIDLDDLGTGFVGRHYNNNVSNAKPVHLVVCVHGLEGNCCDLRLVRAYLELLLPDQRFKFLMSTSNQSDTFTDVDHMADNLVHEVQLAYNSTRSRIVRISFIGHSLGTLIIRAALAKPGMMRFRERFYTFLSLSGPHLGTLYSTSSLVNMGIWLIQKWKKSSSLLQLSLRDHADVRQTFLYKLSQKPGLQFFRNVLFVGSHQDHYVPYHSARIELCRVAAKDTSSTGTAYREMIDNILRPLADPTASVTNVARFDCYFSLPSGADNLIGRAAHVAVLDSDLFLEKFFTVIARKYFV